MGSIFYGNGSRLGLRTSQKSINHTFHPFADLFENFFYPIHPTCLVGVTEPSTELDQWISMIALFPDKRGNAIGLVKGAQEHDIHDQEGTCKGQQAAHNLTLLFGAMGSAKAEPAERVGEAVQHSNSRWDPNLGAPMPQGDHAPFCELRILADFPTLGGNTSVAMGTNSF
jgi:hypothetical protein